MNDINYNSKLTIDQQIASLLGRIRTIANTCANDLVGAVVSSVATTAGTANTVAYRIAGIPYSKVAATAIYTFTGFNAARGLINGTSLNLIAAGTGTISGGNQAPQAGLVTLGAIAATDCPVSSIKVAPTAASGFIGGTTAVTASGTVVYKDVATQDGLPFPSLPVAYNRPPELSTSVASSVGQFVSPIGATASTTAAQQRMAFRVTAIGGTGVISAETASVGTIYDNTAAFTVGTTNLAKFIMDNSILAKVALGSTATYSIYSITYTKAAANSVWTLNGFNVSASNVNKAYLCLDAAGNASCIAGLQAATAALVVPPQIHDNVAVIGILQVTCSATGGFTGGTSLLGIDATGTGTVDTANVCLFIDPATENLTALANSNGAGAIGNNAYYPPFNGMSIHTSPSVP